MIPSDEFQAPSPEELSEMVPGFEVGPVLAAGPESAVYSAIQISLNRQVALRVYSPASSRDPERVASADAASRAMARLKHPNLIGLYDSGCREGMVYVVMEFVAGKSLARSLGGHPIHHAQVRSILSGICEGLAHAHQGGIAHGNLTVEDILLNPEAEPKIGNFRGGEFKIGKFADIAAVGRILYRMLTGLEDSPNSVEPSVLVGSPKDLDEIWTRCVHRDHPDAFISIDQILEVMSQPKAKPRVGHPVAAGRLSAALAVPKPPATKHMPHSDDTPRPSVPAKPPVKVSNGGSSHWILIRNLVLSAVLVFAIMKVWGMKLRKEREIQRQQVLAQERAALEAEKRREEALKKHTSRPVRIPQGPKEQVPAHVQEIKEAPLQELREALKAGRREVLPSGAVKRADSLYLLVREPRAWTEAQWFAEQHGAHLAIPDESADLMWLLTIAEGEPFWLGAAKGGRAVWRLADGKIWQPSKEPVGLGPYLAADKFGFLRAAGAQVRLPCILQWKMDGSNPGELEPLLAAAAESLPTGEPVYPPGTQMAAERAYLVVSRDVDWEESKRLALLAGGHLAVVTDAAEEVHVSDLARNLPPDRLYWLGGRRAEDGWDWVTGEPWRDMGVDADSVTGSALAVSSSTRMQAANAFERQSGFIIEWSKDAASAGPAADGPSSSGLGIDVQAKQLVQAALDKRNKELKANASKMESDLGIISRNMPSSLQRDWSPRIDAVKQRIAGSRVPQPADLEGIELNEEMARVASYAFSKQQAIDQEFTSGANQVREAYQKRLRDMMAKALEAGDRKKVLELKPRLDASEQLESWMAGLGVSSKE